MITIFTTTKPFIGCFGIIQHNALASWARLRPKPHIILFGCEAGAGKVADDIGATHIPYVDCNEQGTPLISDMFKRAEEMSPYDVVCYVNADIILLNDFMRAVEIVLAEKDRFLMVGRRWDVDIHHQINFLHGWEKTLCSHVLANGKLHGHYGIDYFCFSKGIWGELPPFAVGRPAYDNWLLFRARKSGVTVVDATTAVMAIHQNHDYSHVRGGEKYVFKGREAQDNKMLTGGNEKCFHLYDATHEVSEGRVKRILGIWHFRRYVETLPVLHPHTRIPAALLLKGMDAAYSFLERLRTIRRLGFRILWKKM